MADMDEIDDLMRRSAPPALGSDPKNAAEARLIARAVATERRPPRSRLSCASCTAWRISAACWDMGNS